MAFLPHHHLSIVSVLIVNLYVSVNSKPDHLPPRVTPGDSHIPVVPGFGLSLLCLARGSARGGLKSKQKFDNFEKKAQYFLSLKQMSSSSFDMFIYMLEVSSVT